MYKRFYNLQRNPFEITPDPSFLFATRRHNEALAALYYGVRRRKGFVVMTGEVGTGKTMLVRCLLQLMNKNNVNYAYVFNSRLAPTEFLQYIAGDFSLPTAGKSKSELLLELSSFVISRFKKGLTTVLVVDEAHHLSMSVLEEIRLLTNLETAQEKLLQILLVGQPELDEKLDSVDLRQLKQRIALRSHLTALDLDETEGYIHRRLQLAGNPDPRSLFPMEATLEVYRHSKGIPRLINTLCENALIQGYAKQATSITPEMIKEIALEFRLNIVSPTVNDKLSAEEPSDDIRQAARTLLDLYAGLRQPQARSKDKDELGAMVDPGAH
ncbi:MAG TPA: AAA family ATPase [Candidatus Sulfotelmatobacter sp.]|nr:AAA family ATPase [Candidatus Sulfotelmatobacter sp.]